MSDRVWDYISPRKTQQRREKPFKIPAVPLRPKGARKATPEMDHNTKVDHWDTKTPVVAAIDHALLPPSPPSSLSRYRDFDGDTLVHDSVEGLPQEEESEWDANEETFVVDDGQYMDLHKSANHEKEQVRQENQSRKLREAGWSEDAVFMFQKLNMRGFEPLLPDGWVNDFETLPVDLFTANENKAFIKADVGSDFRAQHALDRLFMLGGLARDAVLTNAPSRTAERHINQAVKKYGRWAMQDVGMRHVWNNLSLFDVVSCDKNTPSYIAEQKMIRKLRKLHEQWSEAFQSGGKADLVAAPEPPTLYGVIASHTVMAFVSYVLPTDPNPQGSLRTIAIFDFGQEGYDVWNSLAIAIFVIHCRNRMKQLKEFLPEPVIVHDRDPDL
ncbi:hypothetical protein N0V90_006915 [Kalmusia sp. IMI 367209]|nr:hypothetical protein N0V90_006915 [Kalmusia sp. IMI 367209]